MKNLHFVNTIMVNINKHLPFNTLNRHFLKGNTNSLGDRYESPVSTLLYG